MYKKILVNTSSNLMLHFVRLALVFIMTPILIENLGAYDYGLWEMLVSVVGYAGILSFGFSPALSRFSSDYKAKGDQDNLQLTYSCGLLFLGVIGLAICLIFTFWALFYPETIAPEEGDSYKYALLLLIIALRVLLMFPGLVAESYLEGFQLFYLKNSITLFFILGGAMVIYNFITPLNGILLLAIVNSAGQIIKLSIYMFLLSRPKYGDLNPFKISYSIARIKELASFGGKVFVSGLSGKIESASDSLVIGTILGPQFVPFYTIPANLAFHVKSIALQAIHAFLPAFTELNATSNFKAQKALYFASSKYIVALILPLLVGVALLATPFIDLWIGKGFSLYVDEIMVFLMIYIGFPLLNPLCRSYLTAKNKHTILVKIMPIAAITNLVISIYLVHQVGLVGVAIGSAIPVVFYELFLFTYSLKLLGITPVKYIRKVLIPAILATSMMAGLVYFIKARYTLDSYIEFFVIGLVGGGVYLLIYSLIGLSKAERQTISNKLKTLTLK